MIRATRSITLAFMRLSQQPAFYFRTHSGEENYWHKLKEIKNSEDLMERFQNTKNPEIREINAYCLMMERFRYFPNKWSSSKHFLQTILQLEFDSLSIEMMANIAAVLSIAYKQSLVGYKLVSNFEQTAMRIIEKENENISISNLLKFLKLFVVGEKYKAITATNEILKKKLEKFSKPECNTYITITKQRVIPLPIQKQVFKGVIEQLKQQNEELTNKFFAYRSLCGVSKNLLPDDTFFKDMQKELVENVGDLSQKQLDSLLNYQSRSNPFFKIVLQKIFNEIESNGKTDLDPNLVFKFLNKISEVIPIRNSNQENPQKLINFLFNNPKFIPRFPSFIDKNIFSREQLLKINEIIKAQNILRNKTALKLSLMNQNIFPEQSELDAYLQQIETQFDQNSLNRDNLLRSAILVSRLKIFKRYENEKLVALLNKLKQKISEQAQKNINNIIGSNSFEHYDEFHQRFSNIYFNSFLEKDLEKDKDDVEINLNKLIYLMKSNDMITILKYLKRNQEAIRYGTIEKLINFVLENPLSHKKHFGFLNNLLMHFADLHQKIRKILKYICKQEVQENLKIDDMSSFWKLTSKVLENWSQKADLISFLNYFTGNNLRKLKRDLEYSTFLIAAQMANSKAYSSSSFLFDLKRNNVMLKDFAAEIYDNLQGGQLKTYVKYVAQLPVNINEIEIKPRSLALIFKMLESNPDYAQANRQKLVDAIKLASIDNLEEYISNFEIKQMNKVNSDLFDQMLKCLMEKVKSDYVSFDINLIVKKILECEIRTKKTVEFLNLVMKLAENSNPAFSLKSHELILLALYENNIECKEYIKKLLSYLRSKNFSNLSFESTIKIINLLKIMGKIDLEETTETIDNLISKMKSKNLILGRILPIIIFNDTISEKISKNLLKMVEGLTQFQIIDSHAKYMKEKHPNLNEIIEKAKIKPYRQHENVKIKNNVLKQLLQKNNIPFQTVTKFGRELIVIGDKMLHFIHDIASQPTNDLYKKFISTIFELNPQDAENLIISFTKGDLSKNISKLQDEIQELSKLKPEDIEKLMSNAIKEKEDEIIEEVVAKEQVQAEK